ncbi:unnamed protein product [Peronospora belbahrii]|uniref:Exonuclease domain-containing protein n=2 Tax=Peronospora belbahrii TaxID=622444 RepID=A0ABN8D528_9STRA|nr:unnamed protein product [Peronospora belbahrii]
MTLVNIGVWLLRLYLNLLLFIPRVFLELNLAWNPFVILATIALKRINSTFKTVTDTMVKSNEMRWLHPGERNGERVAIVSYPRCGNSLMRGLLEKVTGVYTGCDTRPDRSLSKELHQYGMKGEGIVDDSVWFVKTHFPERIGYKEFSVKKAILVVRNPWDAIDSYFNMILTNSHNKSLHESQYKRFADRWDGLLRNEIDVWMKFHRYWTTKVDIPIIVVRYEDLIMHREETLRRVFMFLTDLTTLEGTEWENRIHDAMFTSGDKAGPYKPRSGKIGNGCRNGTNCPFVHVTTNEFSKMSVYHELQPPLPLDYSMGMTNSGPVFLNNHPRGLPPSRMRLTMDMKQDNRNKTTSSVASCIDSSTSRQKAPIQANGQEQETISEIFPVLTRDIEGPFFAVDVECVATGNGTNDRDVARIAVVDEDERVVFDQYVKPTKPIVSYLTQLTGITERNLVDAPALEEALVQLKEILPVESVIVGQSIKKDLKWLMLEKPTDYKGEFDVADLFRLPMQSTNGVVRYRYFSLRHVAKYLLGHKYPGGGS